MRIVIGYDGSEYARGAVDDLHRSGLPRIATALVVCVGEVAVPLRPNDVTVDPALSRRVTAAVVQGRAEASQVVSEAQHLAEDGRMRTQQRFPEWAVSSEVLLGSAAPALLEAAEGWDADLVVVGSQGRSAIGRVLLGSVSKQVATESSRSVLVSRYVVERGEAPPRIIIGIDGSAGAVAAAEVIEERTWPNGTMVRVVAVSDSNAAHLQNDGDIVERVAGMLRRAGLQASVESRHGSAQRVLCEEAASWEADCIFVASGGFGTPGERSRTGSLAAGLVTSAPCSVEVVRTRENALEPPLA